MPSHSVVLPLNRSRHFEKSVQNGPGVALVSMSLECVQCWTIGEHALLNLVAEYGTLLLLRCFVITVHVFNVN